MILTGPKIEQEYVNGRITISDFKKDCLSPNSYNVTLGKELLIYKNSLLDAKQDNEVVPLEIPEEGFILAPGRLYLGRTNEIVGSDFYVPLLEGRSSIGRLGIEIHATAGVGETGFHGTWTLEITTTHYVRIYPDTEIGQVYFLVPDGKIVHYGKYGKGGKYQNQILPERSKLFLD